MAKAKYKVFKTKAEYVSAMNEQYELLKGLVSQLNSAESREDADKIEADIKDHLKEHNEYARCAHLMGCIEAGGNPVLNACKNLEYQVLKSSSFRDSDDVRTYTLENDVKYADLLGFGTEYQKGWVYEIQLYWSTVFQELAAAVGTDKQRIDDSVKLFKISKEAITAGKLSNNAKKQIIPKIIAAMIGDEYAQKLTTADVRYLDAVMSSGDKKLGRIKVVKIGECVKYFAAVCAHLVAGLEYEVFTRSMKKQ